ncbi:glycosyltransferase family 2 protein [Candidatus Saccharibacteria bacterium]|nr:glycosyltransferase family 2 protein [Candidatus Saccharibacteria bacterium]
MLGQLKHHIKKRLFTDVDESIQKNIQKFVRSIDREKIRQAKRPADFEGSIEIVIPCYNHGHFLPRALKSIRNQTYKKALTVTVVNDNSQDSSFEVMERLQLENKTKNIDLNLINNDSGSNLKQFGALNLAIQGSKNKLFITLNADDILTTDCLELIVETYKNNPSIYMLGGSSLWFKEGEKLPAHHAIRSQNLALTKYGPKDALQFNHLNSINMSQSSCSFFRVAWELVGGYFPPEKRVCSFDDRDFQMRVSSVLPVGVYQDYPMVYYSSDTSVSRTVEGHYDT